MSGDLQGYLNSPAFLPEPLQDTHKLKDVFKALDEIVENRRKAAGGARKDGDINWCDAYVYTTDIFLWFMAEHGYTLQKSRKDLPFLDLEATMKEWKALDRERMEQKYKESLGK